MQSILRLLKKVWRYFVELEEYKWNHGSSCCTHSFANPNDGLFSQHYHPEKEPTNYRYLKDSERAR